MKCCYNRNNISYFIHTSVMTLHEWSAFHIYVNCVQLMARVVSWRQGQRHTCNTNMEKALNLCTHFRSLAFHSNKLLGDLNYLTWALICLLFKSVTQEWTKITSFMALVVNINLIPIVYCSCVSFHALYTKYCWVHLLGHGYFMEWTQYSVIL